MRRNNFSIRQRCLKKFEKNNVTISLNVLYAKKEKIYPAYVSKNNSNHKNGSKGKKWHDLSQTKIISIIKRNHIKNNGDFYYLNCLHSFRTKDKLESF